MKTLTLSLAALLCTSVPGQLAWTKHDLGIDERSEHWLVYDGVNQKVLMFGCRDCLSNLASGCWHWDGLGLDETPARGDAAASNRSCEGVGLASTAVRPLWRSRWQQPGALGHVGMGRLELDASGCSVLVDTLITLGLTCSNGQGVASVPFPIPVNPAVAGINIYAQGLTLDLGAPLGFAASRGLRFRIGD